MTVLISSPSRLGINIVLGTWYLLCTYAVCPMPILAKFYPFKIGIFCYLYNTGYRYVHTYWTHSDMHHIVHISGSQMKICPTEDFSPGILVWVLSSNFWVQCFAVRYSESLGIEICTVMYFCFVTSGTRDILVRFRMRILGSVPLTKGPNAVPDPELCFIY
jgi:hypothetical protein